jgi:type IV secretion system protein VirB9
MCYQTQISFAPNEAVQNVSIGNSLAWQVVPVHHYLFIKSVASSKTNMTISTNPNSYNFQLDSLNPNAAPIYKLQFIYPDWVMTHSGSQNAESV